MLRRLIGKIPMRTTIGAFIFFCMFTSPFFNTSFSVILLAMVNAENLAVNGTIVELPDYGPRYNWDSYQQGLILGAMFIGRACSAILTGTLVDKFGTPKVFVTITLSMGSLLYFLSPLAAKSFGTMYATRFIWGMLGNSNPSLFYLVSRWAPPSERGTFMSTFFGVDIGHIIALSTTGAIIEALGWYWSFFIPAIWVSIFVICSLWIVYDTPAKHPRISAGERQYIEKSLVGVHVGPKKWPPIFKMFTCPPFLALVILQFGTMYGIYFMSTATPRFLFQVMGFNISDTGFLTSLPYLVRVVTGTCFGRFNDYLTTTRKVPRVWIRKCVPILSHIIPGCFLICIPLVSSDPYWCIAFMVISYGFSGAVSMGGFINVQELAPNYVATIMSVINTFTVLNGFLSPLLVAHITRDNNTIREWNTIFQIGASIYFVSAVIFMIFGSVEIQSWNRIDNDVVEEVGGEENDEKRGTVEVEKIVSVK